MRKDIEIHIQTGDVALESKNKLKLREFRWVEQPELLSRYIYGEIDVPYTVSERTIRSQGLACVIPYTPRYKEFMIRVRRVNEDGFSTYLMNKADGSQWFLAKSAIYGEASRNVFASELPSISEEAFFIDLNDNHAQIYSCGQSDFNIVPAARQNANCLLACYPGGNYRYPLTGVGLARWINSNSAASASLTQTLQDEFRADGVIIKNAVFDYDTNQMELEASDIVE